jgi:uncharacterized membrane protein YoaK (UPF0700 family)
VPLHYARSLLGPARSSRANRHLGVTLAFVAGAINAGGFIAVHQYTSHLTGVISSAADNLVSGAWNLALAAFGAALAFMLGSACTALTVNYGRRRGLASEYALPLLVEALLLLAFGALSVSATVMLLCFMMGLQNALITKLSQAEIRTTHLTGIVTDIGIEVGRMLYWNRDPAQPKVAANRARLRLLVSLLLGFFSGAVAGALGFKHAGHLATLPLAGVLCLLAIVPAVDDLRRARVRQV